jgi:hypothetical protein
MIKTTIYNQANAVTTGFYFEHSSGKAVKHTIELLGTEAECMDAIELLQSNEDIELVHTVVRHSVKSVFPVYSNPLFAAWNTPVNV